MLIMLLKVIDNKIQCKNKKLPKYRQSHFLMFMDNVINHLSKILLFPNIWPLKKLKSKNEEKEEKRRKEKGRKRIEGMKRKKKKKENKIFRFTLKKYTS